MMDSYGGQTRREQRFDPSSSGSSVFPKRTILEFAFLAFALAPLLHFGSSPFLGTFSVVFAAIVLEALPFLLIGSVVSGFLGGFDSQGKVIRLLSKGGARTPFVAVALGLFFPVCECAIVPIVRKLMQKGVPPAAAIAFMLGAPIVNPIVFGSTAVAYGLAWDFAFLRLVFGYCIAVFVSFIFAFGFRGKEALLPSLSVFPFYDHVPQNVSGTPAYYVEKTRAALIHGAEDFIDMFSLLVMAAFVTALVHSTVDRSLFYSLGEIPVLGIVLMMVLAVILSICSEADAFIAASFQLSLPLSAQMAFMVLGPMVDLKLIFMCLGVFKKRAILLVAGTSFLAVLGLMLVFDGYVQWVLS
jgi:uncharacterized protein